MPAPAFPKIPKKETFARRAPPLNCRPERGSGKQCSAFAQGAGCLNLPRPRTSPRAGRERRRAVPNRGELAQTRPRAPPGTCWLLASHFSCNCARRRLSIQRTSASSALLRRALAVSKRVDDEPLKGSAHGHGREAPAAASTATTATLTLPT